jgi:hypothetical protein
MTNAARSGCPNVAKWLLDHGADLDPGAGVRTTPLMSAAMSGKLEMVKFLVEQGANVNASWGKEYPRSALSFALDYGRQEVADYLRSLGAIDAPPPPSGPLTPREEILDYVAATVGPVGPLALIEIVPVLFMDIHPVSVKGESDSKMLITTGMSDTRMDVPEGSEGYAFAEVSIFLPVDWPLSKSDLGDPNNYWPVKWLRIIGYYPYEEGELIGPDQIISNGDPPEPLAANTGQSCMLVIENCMLGPLKLKDGRSINFYQLIPLYKEERDLQMTKGTEYLIRLFVANGISPVVGPNRPNVALLPEA